MNKWKNLRFRSVRAFSSFDRSHFLWTKRNAYRTLVSVLLQKCSNGDKILIFESKSHNPSRLKVERNADVPSSNK